MSGQRTTMKHTRRSFLRIAPLGGLALLMGSRPAGAHTGFGATCSHMHPHHTGLAEHPVPREGVDASRVVPADKLMNPAVSELFDEIRKIPEVADGVFCYCGCSNLPGHYSLLSCYEPGGTGQWCEICQGEGRLVVRRHREGQSLDQIRRAIDARYG